MLALQCCYLHADEDVILAICDERRAVCARRWRHDRLSPTCTETCTLGLARWSRSS